MFLYHAKTFLIDPSKLPLRTHNRFMNQADDVQKMVRNTEHEALATQYGIKGVPLLSALSSLSFPISFPYDFMHLIWANLIVNLIHLWTGQFKDLDHSEEGYVLEKTVWETIAEAGAQAGKHIPSAFGSRVPNLAAEKSHMTCEKYSVWTLYLAPALLKGRFKEQRFYRHFLRLVELLNLCLEFELLHHQVNELNEGFRSWVIQYEEYIFLLDLHGLTF